MGFATAVVFDLSLDRLRCVVSRNHRRCLPDRAIVCPVVAGYLARRQSLRSGHVFYSPDRAFLLSREQPDARLRRRRYCVARNADFLAEVEAAGLLAADG